MVLVRPTNVGEVLAIADVWNRETGNLNWYDPETITTKNGSLVISLFNQESHGLQYEGKGDTLDIAGAEADLILGGLISTWNKFCFTGGLFEGNGLRPSVSYHNLTSFPTS